MSDDKLPLTPAHLDIIEFLVQGLTPIEIAHKRYSSINTIRTQIKAIHERLGVNRTEAIILWWFNEGSKEKYYPCAHDARDEFREPLTPCRQFETRPCVELSVNESMRYRREECDPKSCVRFPARDRID